MILTKKNVAENHLGRRNFRSQSSFVYIFGTIIMVPTYFHQNFNFWKKTSFFWQMFRFLTKISIFDKILFFDKCFDFLTKILILYKNVVFWQKFRFLTYFGGLNVDSRNSSIFGTSVRTSPSNSINGGFVPGAISASSFGLLKWMIKKNLCEFYFNFVDFFLNKFLEF